MCRAMTELITESGSDTLVDQVRSQPGRRRAWTEHTTADATRRRHDKAGTNVTPQGEPEGGTLGLRALARQERSSTDRARPTAPDLRERLGWFDGEPSADRDRDTGNSHPRRLQAYPHQLPDGGGTAGAPRR